MTVIVIRLFCVALFTLRWNKFDTRSHVLVPLLGILDSCGRTQPNIGNFCRMRSSLDCLCLRIEVNRHELSVFRDDDHVVFLRIEKTYVAGKLRRFGFFWRFFVRSFGDGRAQQVPAALLQALKPYPPVSSRRKKQTSRQLPLQLSLKTNSSSFPPGKT